MKSLLIANRGEVAIRIARAARAANITPCGIHAQDDVAAPYLAWMQTSAPLPGTGPAAYLDVAAIIQAAQRLGADALHPGWGFLSETPALARACTAAGLLFVGPSAALLDLLGDKLRAREAAVASGVPVAAHAAGLAGARALLQAGPILLKPAGGGGGRGMRVVTDAGGLDDAWQAAGAEAALAFGNAAIFAEALITGARHVEVQMAADGTHAVSLGTRDCSLQRRHQKLAETAPAAPSPALEDAACAMAARLGYAGLGTWEFLVTPNGFWFMEVNPRLQVEHTVTEAVTGLDLVAIQLRLAEGASLAALGLSHPPAPRGFALQLRINAERLTATGQTLSETGRITAFTPPTGPGIRVDHAVAEGMIINPAYDSLLAKLIVHGPDRAACLARAAAAVGEFRIEGVRTLLPMMARLLALEAVRADRIDTRFIEANAALLADPEIMPAGDTGTLLAPMAGLVVTLDVSAGDTVRSGQRVALIEAMKMQMEVRAAAAATVRTLAVRVGETVSAGQVLAWLDPAADAGHDDAADTQAPIAIRADLTALRTRLLATLDEGRPDAVARRHAAGRRTARENLDDLFDAGSFSEYGALALAAQRRRRGMEELIRISPADGMVAGIGTVAGRSDRGAGLRLHGHGRHAGLPQPQESRPAAGRGPCRPPAAGALRRGRRRPPRRHGCHGRGRAGFVHLLRLRALQRSGAAGRHRGRPLLRRQRRPARLLRHDHRHAGQLDRHGRPGHDRGRRAGRVPPRGCRPEYAVQSANGVIDILVRDEAEATNAARRYLGYFGPAPTRCSPVPDQARLAPRRAAQTASASTTCAR